MVSVVPVAPVNNRPLLPLPPKTTLPVPSSVCVPEKLSWLKVLPSLAPSVAVPLSVSPLVTVALPELLAPSRSLLRVTPLNVPPELVSTSWAPPAPVTVPPLTVPPASCHEPVVAVRAKVAAALFSVPVMLTMPPVRLNVPRSAVLTVPSRLTVPALTVMVPLLLQAPRMVSVPPPLPSRLPELDNVVPKKPTTIIPPAASALMAPWLTRL
jgi:hypothetical protein